MKYEIIKLLNGEWGVLQNGNPYCVSFKSYKDAQNLVKQYKAAK